MYLCYLDESGTTGAGTGDTSHFVLAGLSIPIWHWRDADREVSRVLAAYGLADAELHTAWMLRKYLEQSRIPGFEQLDAADRRTEVRRRRSNELTRLSGPANDVRRRRARKLHRNTEPYVHLTWEERRQAVFDVAETVSNWGFARLFAECVDKSHFDPARSPRSVSEQAFEQVVSRFERYLQNLRPRGTGPGAQRNHGLLVHDNNETVARRHTRMMRSFHAAGTPWTSVECIIETPMFVDSKLTRMVQIADLCAYALRRYLENGETGLFRQIFARADRISAAPPWAFATSAGRRATAPSVARTSPEPGLPCSLRRFRPCLASSHRSVAPTTRTSKARSGGFSVS